MAEPTDTVDPADPPDSIIGFVTHGQLRVVATKAPRSSNHRKVRFRGAELDCVRFRVSIPEGKLYVYAEEIDPSMRDSIASHVLARFGQHVTGVVMLGED